MSAFLSAQENEDTTETATKDVTQQNVQYYGLRIGVDLSKPVRSLLDDQYSGLEIVGDFRVSNRYYVAAELGNETFTVDEFSNIDVTSSGSYIKAGFNYNAYNNWFGMNNLIYAGVRAGFSTFTQELNTYTISTSNTFFEEDVRTDTREFDGLNATWLEFQLGIQTELFSNFYLGINLQIKNRVTETEPDGFENVYIPGFGKTTDESKFGVGYGYTLSYLIPIFKK
ncbi:hypothetical protein GCM10011344_38190 [Dokdonia pacifica]|uniref:Outer membrane protein beta-barrel domain-containing protein n=1 Tax=Dokdonia pacifica TaxID=1627892 RepID=A0A239B5W0_9FLAO|nr:DUF6048 family protein [Dokdonia pacifica]GGG33742.1 hypothetical protein GCM10011344_38190 [Dokdonia pacifica]SNS03280.1 hypothetical protein SAMN06265376_105368 [Dokdonia pacifica]